jgi:tight adherence protein B
MTVAALLLGAALVAARWSRPPRRAPGGGGEHSGGLRPRRSCEGVDQLIAFLDAAAQGCRAGLSLGPACLDAEVRAGISMPVAHGAVPLDTDQAVVAHAVAVAKEFGGPMALTLDSAATVLRERRAMRAIRASHTAAARLSARVLTALPLLFTAFNCAVSESARQVLIGSEAGVACLVIGLVLNAVGWWWMRIIVAERP